MRKIKAYSVRLADLKSISPKAYKATAFDGSSAIIPKSMVFGRDDEVQRTSAYWIAAFILEKKLLQYSSKKTAWFDERGNMLPNYVITTHCPERKTAVDNNIIKELIRE